MLSVGRAGGLTNRRARTAYATSERSRLASFALSTLTLREITMPLKGAKTAVI